MTDTSDQTVYDSNRLVNVMGLPKLLLAVAARLENSDGEGLNRELLQQAAQRIVLLEAIATVATHVVSLVPYRTKRNMQRSSKVPRDTLIRLCDALNELPEFRVRRVR
jgi:hypothetical protein